MMSYAVRRPENWFPVYIARIKGRDNFGDRRLIKQLVKILMLKIAAELYFNFIHGLVNMWTINNLEFNIKLRVEDYWQMYLRMISHGSHDTTYQLRPFRQ